MCSINKNCMARSERSVDFFLGFPPSPYTFIPPYDVADREIPSLCVR